MIILTGGAGFVGNNILRAFNAGGESDVLIVDNLKVGNKYRNLVGTRFTDYLPKAEFRERLRRGTLPAGIRAICHQGACTDTMEYDGHYMMDNNFEYSKELLHYALEQRVPFVYASSAATYGHVDVAREDDGTEAPLNIYGYSKLAFDQYVRTVAANAASTVVGLRYFNVYGPYEGHKGKMASMVYQLAKQVQETGQAKIFGAIGKYGPGGQRRDFIYVKDLVDLNLFFLNGTPRVTVVNAGSGGTRTFKELAEIVVSKLGKGLVEYIPFPDSLVDRYQFNTASDLTKLRSLGYTSEMRTLEEGVSEYLDLIPMIEAPFKARTE